MGWSRVETGIGEQEHLEKCAERTLCTSRKTSSHNLVPPCTLKISRKKENRAILKGALKRKSPNQRTYDSRKLERKPQTAHPQ